MAQGAGAIAIEPNFSGNDGQGRRLALRADHGHTSGKGQQGDTRLTVMCRKITLIRDGPVQQGEMSSSGTGRRRILLALNNLYWPDQLVVSLNGKWFVYLPLAPHCSWKG
jgi:hypothetical protein